MKLGSAIQEYTDYKRSLGMDFRTDATRLRAFLRQTGDVEIDNPWSMKYNPQRLVFFALDLLHLDGVDLRGRALIERWAELAKKRTAVVG